MAGEGRLESPGVSEGDDGGPLITVDLSAPDEATDVAPAEVGVTDAAAASVAARLAALALALRAEPQTFGFFQAVRLLERLQPDRAPVGALEDPAREAVRFSVNPSLAFPPSELHDLRIAEGQQPAMKVNFMGLIGPQGVLPHPYSMLVAERLKARDTALADFLDLFHHRLLSLFYRAWRAHRFTLDREDGEPDRLAQHLADLIGLGLDSTRERLPFPDEALIYRAGLLAPQPRGAVALQQLLQDFFDVPVEVHQFVGAWYRLEERDLCVVGDEDSECARLGLGAVAGDEVWDQQARVRVTLGPLTRSQYDDFLPGAAGHDALRALLRFYSHDQFDFEVQLILARDDVTGIRLEGVADGRQRLGWSTWICAAGRTRDADETILTLQHEAAS
jgi:type VI secretion system protein ImpH